MTTSSADRNFGVVRKVFIGLNVFACGTTGFTILGWMKMLISPQHIHRHLYDIVSSGVGHVPHTALLIVPQGQLISSASTYGSNPSDQLIGEADEEVQWLAGPERVRLLLGLASQWEEDESDLIECEVCRGTGSHIGS